MSKKTSGKCITEGKIRSKMINLNYLITKTKEKEEISHTSNSQETGPSYYKCTIHVTRVIPTSLSMDTDTETDEKEIADEENRCVCKKFTPDEVRNSVYISFAK